ncbi:MAG: HEAT repeat domain-containing protein [Nitrospirales bacterium]
MGDTRALEGISAIKTPKATQVLLDFLNAPNPAVVYSAWSAVSRRLPDPHILKTLASGHLKPENNLAHFLDRKAEIDATWRPEFIPLIRSSIPGFLNSQDESLRLYAARIMSLFPDQTDLPLLAKALTKAIEDYDNISSRARQRVPNFLAAAESLAQYQDVIPQNPHTDGEIALYILGVKWAYRNTGIARKEMEEKIRKWRGHPSEVIRQIIDRE